MRDGSGKSLGRAGEELAAQYLAREGLEILERNFRVREGEIDLVARDGDIIVFVEVKTRRGREFGLPVESVDEKKQERIRRVAEIFLAGKDWMEREVRFDIFTLRFDRPQQKWLARWIRQAF